MNSNPFGPQGAYAQQPPLPPGPPPTQPVPVDYSQYWAAQQAHAAAQQAVPPIGTYNTQWTAQPQQQQQQQQPTPEQSALYANYGYGAQWQQRSQQQQQAAQQVTHFAPPPPIPPQPLPTPVYNPYQPQPGYPQQYVPQPPQPQQYFPVPVAAAAQPPPPLPQQPRNQQHPAKRQRFDGPNQNNRPGQGGPGGPGPGMYVPGPQQSMQPQQMQMQMSPARGGPTGPRASMDRGGRGNNNRGGGGPMNMNGRGGGGPMAPRGGRGGGGGGGFAPNTSGPGRGGGMPGQQQQSRGGGGRGNFSARGGGSFNAGRGGFSNTSQSFRGGRGGGGPPRGGSSSSSFSSRDAKKSDNENRRTLTDFKIVGLEIRELGWTWGALPKPTEPESTSDSIKRESVEGADHEQQSATTLSAAPERAPVESDADLPPSGGSAFASTPPSRIRLYFHTPVSPDDSHPIPHSSSNTLIQAAPPPPPTDHRKGKRKKLEDDDGELEEGRAAPPPPQMRNAAVDGSASPGGQDWLMAAIVSREDTPNGNVSVDMEHGADSSHAVAIDPPTRGVVATPVLPVVVEEPTPAVTPPTQVTKDGSTTERESQVDTEPANQADESQGSEVPTDAADVSRPPLALALAEESAATEPPHTPRSPTTLALTVLSHDREPTAEPLEPQVNGSPSHGSSSFTSTLAADEGSSSQTIGTQAEPPLSPLASGSTVAATVIDSLLPVTKVKTPSPNRMSISYAAGNRRLVVDAESVQSLKVFRADGRVEVKISIVKEEDGDGLSGIWLEGLADSTNYHTLDILSDAWETDPTSPPFAHLPAPSTLTLVVHLDTERPLSEPKWVKSGDVQEWLKSLFGRMFWVAGDAAAVGWEKKIEVEDPDPPPTIYTILDQWAGNFNDRHSFLKGHILGHKNESDAILEILLRLIRGERATPYSQSAPAISAPSLSGPLLSAMHSSPYGAQQTHVSLAVLAMAQLTLEFAKLAKGDDEIEAKRLVDEQIGEIVRCLPAHLVFKSLDGIFKEWKGDTKKGR